MTRLTVIRRGLTAIIGGEPCNAGLSRVRRAGWGGITGVFSRGTAIAVSLISVPLTVDYLGSERYGVWITISSIIAWLVVSDIGFGSSLMNAIADAHGKDDASLAQGFFATAFWTLFFIGAAIASAGLLLLPFLDLHAIFNIPEHSTYFSEIRLSLGLAFVFFCLSIPTGLVNSVYNAYQETEKGNYWTTAGSLVSLLALLIVIRYKGGIPLLVLALMGTISVLRIFNLIVLFTIEKPNLKPFPRLVQKCHFQKLWGLGRYYMVQQLGNIGMFHLQPLLLTQFLSPMAVGPFIIAYRLLTLPQQLLMLFLVPLVGAYGEARIRSDWRWIRKTVFLTVSASFVFMLIVSSTLASFNEQIVTWWVGSSMLSDSSTVYWLSLYAVSSGIATPLAIFLQGFECARDIAIFTLANGLLLVLGAFYFIPLSGEPGMAAAMALSYIIVNCGYQIIIASKLLKSEILVG